MKVVITESEKNMGIQAANLIAEEIRKNPDAVLSLSTGATPVGCYKELIRLYEEQGLDFGNVKSFNMDEYAGLSKDHAQGFYYFMYKQLYEHVNIDLKNTFSPDAVNENLAESIQKFEMLIEQEGGFDLILLGIGRDGHIAFNMPDRELKLSTHVQELSESTMNDNARFFDDKSQVPNKAITVGVKNIMDSRKIVLIASGEAKSDIMARFISSDSISPDLPATVLKLHPDVTVIMDKAAAGKLNGTY